MVMVVDPLLSAGTAVRKNALDILHRPVAFSKAYLYYCTICDVAHSNQESVLTHELHHHARGVILCSVCRREHGFYTLQYWPKHVDEVHGSSVVKATPQKENKETTEDKESLTPSQAEEGESEDNTNPSVRGTGSKVISVEDAIAQKRKELPGQVIPCKSMERADWLEHAPQ